MNTIGGDVVQGINKAIDLLIKASEEMENEERKEQTIGAIHSLSKLQQDCYGDMKKEDPSQ